MSEYFLIGEIKSIFNNKGFVSIKSYSDFPDKILRLKKVFVDIFGAKRIFYIENIDFKKPNFVLKFKNFYSSDDLHFLMGKKIYIEEHQLPRLQRNEFFVHDLVGSQVFIEDKFLGKLLEVFHLPANDVYSVISEEGKEILIPAVKKFISKFDSNNKKLFLTSDFEFLEDDEN